VGDSCEHGYDPSGSIKCWEILVVERLAASQEVFSSMELFIIRTKIVIQDLY
jgi:hypothetical protein